jgi:hypothetical protein
MIAPKLKIKMVKTLPPNGRFPDGLSALPLNFFHFWP